MVVRKNGQYLVFDFQDGSDVRYDLANKTTIGKLGNPVKDLKSQLKGYTVSQIVDCCENKQYGKFLKFIQNAEGNQISNIGTILERSKKYAMFEQFFSSGINHVNKNVSCDISDVPSGLINLCKRFDFQLCDGAIRTYKSNPDVFHLAFSLQYSTLTHAEVWGILISQSKYFTPRLYTLIGALGYNLKSLLLYVDYLKTHEALSSPATTVSEIYDYATMMQKISGKFEKYPRNFLTTHNIASRNYNRLKEEFDEDCFANRRDKRLECKIGDFQFIYPETTQDIKDEAAQQGNCVASYIKRVLDGKCHIVFMRKSCSPQNSLVTIEVCEGRIVQAKGRSNREVTDAEQSAIDAYNKRLKKENVT